MGRAGFEGRAGRRATAAALVGSIVPDGDHVVEFGGSAAYLELHRGWTHSLVAMAVWAGLCWWLFGRGRDGPARRAIALAGAVGLASHIFLDCITAFGTVWLIPFDRTRAALDWIFIVDLAFSGLLAAGMIAGWVRPARATGAARAGLAAAALYLGLCALHHDRALFRVRELAATRGEPVLELAALPAPPHVFRWRGLIRTATRVHEVRLGPWGGEPEWLEPLPAADLRAPGVPLTDDLRALAGMARFLVQEKGEGPEGTVHVFYDRQFAAIPGRRVYEVTVAVDRDGRVRSGFSDANVTARTLLFALLIALVAAAMWRWEREAA